MSARARKTIITPESRPPEVKRTVGAFKGRGPKLSAEDLRKAAERAITEEAVKR